MGSWNPHRTPPGEEVKRKVSDMRLEGTFSSADAEATLLPGRGCHSVPDGCRRARKRGFSAVELIYVMVLMGILVAIAAPRWSVAPRRVHAAVVTVQSRISAVQRMAVLRQHDVRLLFHVTDGYMVVHEDRDNDGERGPDESVHRVELGEGAAFGLAGAAPIPGFAGPVSFSEGVDGVPVLTFRRNGSVSEEGVIYLTSAEGNQPDLTRALRIQRASAQVSCSYPRSGDWKEGC
jgi:prepilin-type N-terminal cleavage/methylation domain-containing protein